MSRTIYRHPWKVICPDGRTRAFRVVTKDAAVSVAMTKSLEGCHPFPDDPSRWWKKPCPGGNHRVARKRRGE